MGYTWRGVETITRTGETNQVVTTCAHSVNVLNMQVIISVVDAASPAHVNVIRIWVI